MRYSELRRDAQAALNRGISKPEVRELAGEVADSNGKLGKTATKQLQRLKAEFAGDFTGPGKAELTKLLAAGRIELRPRSSVSSYG